MEAGSEGSCPIRRIEESRAHFISLVPDFPLADTGLYLLK